MSKSFDLELPEKEMIRILWLEAGLARERREERLFIYTILYQDFLSSCKAEMLQSHCNDACSCGVSLGMQAWGLPGDRLV